MQRVLDNSPVLLQPVPTTKRSLKRTASVASLPTPPRTTHKHKRSRKDDIDFEEKLETSDSEPDIQSLARTLFKPSPKAEKSVKKAKNDEKSKEDAFWTGDEVDNKSPKARPRSTIGSAPVSPPVSRSKQVGPRFQTPPPLPERLGVYSPTSLGGTPLGQLDDRDGPIRDSPNNLFLVESKKSFPPQPVKDETEDFEEPPTVKYVFRGKGIEIMNPMYNMSPRVHAKSKLPPEDPEYSPSPTVKPKRLFAKELDMKAKVRAATKRRRSSTPPSPSPATRPKRAAGSPKSKTKDSPSKTRSSSRSKSPKKKRTAASRV